jgi:hypothetical protein
VQRSAWTLLLFLLSVVVCASAIPPTDLPETTYNEVDAPVNQAPPFVPGIKLVRPAVAPVMLPMELCPAGRDVLPRHPVATPAVAGQHPDSLQDLLCTFLI